MAGNTANIFVGAPNRTVGAVMVAPVGTALPTDVTTAPNVAFKDLGYISEDGLSLDQASTWQTIRDWGGDQVRKFLSDFTGTLSFAPIETNPEVLKFVFGAANVTTTAATVSTGTKNAIKINSTEPDRTALISNLLDGPRAMRIVVPICQVTERSTLQFAKNSAITHPITVEAYPDSTGNSVYWYTDDGVFSA